METRIKVADLSEFDSARYLDSKTAIAVYLADVLEANNAALMTSSLETIVRARGTTEIAKSAGIRGRFPSARPR